MGLLDILPGGVRHFASGVSFTPAPSERPGRRNRQKNGSGTKAGPERRGRRGPTFQKIHDLLRDNENDYYVILKVPGSVTIIL